MIRASNGFSRSRGNRALRTCAVPGSLGGQPVAVPQLLQRSLGHHFARALGCQVHARGNGRQLDGLRRHAISGGSVRAEIRPTPRIHRMRCLWCRNVASRGSLALCRSCSNQKNLERATGHGKPSPLVKPSGSFIAEHPNRSIEVHQNIIVAQCFAEPFTEVWPEFSNLWVQDEPNRCLADHSLKPRRVQEGFKPN